MAKTIIGVMGPGAGATQKHRNDAYEIGRRIAQKGWVLLTGGRNVGVMEAATTGAKEAGGLTIGVLPGSDRRGMATGVDIPLITGMGSARNNINVLSSDVIVACGSGLGTASEIVLALKANKPLLLIHQETSLQDFLKKHSSHAYRCGTSPEEIIRAIEELL